MHPRNELAVEYWPDHDRPRCISGRHSPQFDFLKSKYEIAVISPSAAISRICRAVGGTFLIASCLVEAAIFSPFSVRKIMGANRSSVLGAVCEETVCSRRAFAIRECQPCHHQAICCNHQKRHRAPASDRPSALYISRFWPLLEKLQEQGGLMYALFAQLHTTHRPAIASAL